MSESNPSSPPAAEPAAPAAATAEKTAKKPAQKPAQKHERKELPPYNVVLLNDDEHTYAYVIEMLRHLFGYSVERAYDMARMVDQSGRVIVLTTHKEKAELKRDQIRGFGSDPRVASCQSSMGAVVEPVEG